MVLEMWKLALMVMMVPRESPDLGPFLKGKQMWSFVADQMFGCDQKNEGGHLFLL